MPSIDYNTSVILKSVAVAKFSFSGKNNDELCFLKGDIIAISQKTDEGWWEGTLNGKTGWFPSSYVTEVENTELPQENVASDAKNGAINGTPIEDSHLMYRKIIIEDFVDSERTHLQDLQTLYSGYLIPLKQDNLLTAAEINHLFCNMDDIITCHKDLLTSIELTIEKSTRDQKIGAAFMQLAIRFKSLLKIYCKNHPIIVEILAKNREKLAAFMEKNNSDLLTLISSVSSPFRRFEKYPNFLSELERNLEENHSDRGDTQRAAAVYRDLVVFCGNERKQKETHLDLLNCEIIDWAGPPLSSYGDYLFMKCVDVLDEKNEWIDRFLILFPTCLLVLQVSHQLNAYIFKKKIPLNETVLIKRMASGQCDLLEDMLPGQALIQLICKSSMDQSLTVTLFTFLTPNGEESSAWLENFKLASLAIIEDTSTSKGESNGMRINNIEKHELPKSEKLHVSNTMPVPGHAEYKNTLYNQQLQQQQNALTNSQSCDGTLLSNNGKLAPSHQPPSCSMPVSKSLYQSTTSRSDIVKSAMRSNAAAQTLRPLAPNEILRNAALLAKSEHVKLRKKDSNPNSTHLDEDEADILGVIEAYLSSTVNQGIRSAYAPKATSESPQLLVPEDEKLLVEEWVGDELVIQEKSLVDTVYSLKDQMNEVKQELKRLTVLLLEEQKARKGSDELIKKLLISSQRQPLLKNQINGIGIDLQPATNDTNDNGTYN